MEESTPVDYVVGVNGCSYMQTSSPLNHGFNWYVKLTVRCTISP